MYETVYFTILEGRARVEQNKREGLEQKIAATREEEQHYSLPLSEKVPIGAPNKGRREMRHFRRQDKYAELNDYLKTLYEDKVNYKNSVVR